MDGYLWRTIEPPGMQWGRRGPRCIRERWATLCGGGGSAIRVTPVQQHDPGQRIVSDVNSLKDGERGRGRQLWDN